MVKLIRADKKSLRISAKQHKERLMKDPISKQLLMEDDEQVKREEKRIKEAEERAP